MSNNIDINAGTDRDVVISSRVRLARNYQDIPFPPMMNPTWAQESIQRASNAVGACGTGFSLRRLRDMPELERMRLMEHHLISPALVSRPETSAVLMHEDHTVSVMVNEEDHLRIQAILPGLALEECAQLANQVDDCIEQQSEYAFDPTLGYLTSCPTNTGTGLRGSVMMHLPALSIIGQMGAIVQAVGKIGLTVRGMYGEGSEAAGYLYQLSNQVTLGRSEEDILSSLRATALQVIEHEREARRRLLEHSRIELEDRLMRSYGIFMNARRMDSKEFMKLWSDVRLGVDLGIIKHVGAGRLNTLLEDVQPASLVARSGRELNPQERDILRSEIIKETLGGISNGK